MQADKAPSVEGREWCHLAWERWGIEPGLWEKAEGASGSQLDYKIHIG